jgi:NAD(P)-dependent dehydrogenase (short-subunit alcohol dehydrogenase family)
MAGRLAHKHAVITGGAAGIGLAIALGFGREGARVAILDCDPARLEDAGRALRDAGIDNAGFQADVADGKAVEGAFAAIRQHFGDTVHVLVNNAGIVDFGAVEDTELDAWRRIIDTNLTGTFLCSQAVLPAMREGGGAIVNMASVAGQIGFPRLAAYCASKGGIIALTRQMAVDYTPRAIRVNCICPGRISGTELDRWIRSVDSEAATAGKMAKYPMGRFGQPEEVAQAALYLASDESAFVSGIALTVDGGLSAL